MWVWEIGGLLCVYLFGFLRVIVRREKEDEEEIFFNRSKLLSGGWGMSSGGWYNSFLVYCSVNSLFGMNGYRCILGW